MITTCTCTCGHVAWLDTWLVKMFKTKYIFIRFSLHSGGGYGLKPFQRNVHVQCAMYIIHVRYNINVGEISMNMITFLDLRNALNEQCKRMAF